jgi:Glycosyl transferase family 2
MPWSVAENRDWVLETIDPSDVVLDVGAGSGTWGDNLFFPRHRIERIDAVEIHEPYIDRFLLRNKYHGVMLGDFRELAIPTNIYDVVILGSIMNHFSREDALKVWEKARLIAGPFGIVIATVPIDDVPEYDVEENVHGIHRSTFTMEDLKALSGVVDSKDGSFLGCVLADGLETPTADDLSVLITTIPIRKDRLGLALHSVEGQTLQPAHVVISEDTEKAGAAINRDNGIGRVETKYVAILDDDDFFYADHLETLYRVAVDTDADIVYSWFDVHGGIDPFPQNFGKEWDPDNPIQTTVTVLAKTDVIRKAGGYTGTYGASQEELDSFSQGNTAGEDFRMIYNANKMDAKIVHVPKKTWAYVHWNGNTSGRNDRW